jgi:pimeloyl-ACP methyl ester carboxylesterase
MAEIPLLVIIPGWWQPTDSWHDFLTAARKQNAGFEGIVVSLPSKTDVASRQAGLPRDVAAVRAALETVVEEGRMVVLLCHCSGGIIGSNAVEGYDLAARRRAGKQGGVMSIIYLAAFILPKRHTLFGIVGNLDIYQWVHIDV